MERDELYCLIDLPPEIIPQLEQAEAELNLGEINSWLEQMLDMETAAHAYRQLKGILGEDDGSIKMLCCQLECARRVWDRYQARQIGETIYRDTMGCFSRFLAECRKKNGRMFFDRGWWTYRQTSMSLFRIGALEYEFRAHNGENAIAIHIPSDADLSPHAVDASLDQAESFFQARYPDYSDWFYTCNSWLLSPALRPLLAGGTSNILSFQNRFRVVSEDAGDMEYIEWLFQVPTDTAAAKLPAETRLQKRVKELIRSGGTVGSAYGIIDRGQHGTFTEKGGDQ